MSDQQVRVTVLDVQRAKLLQSLAKRLGKTPPPSVGKVAQVQVVDGAVPAVVRPAR